MKNLILLFIFSIIITETDAQILGKVFDRAKDRIEDKISDEINKAVYRELEKQALKATDKAMDDMLRDRYEQDSIAGKPEARDYSGFLQAFTTPVDLPEKYVFDMVLIAEVKDYDKEKSEMEMMITKDGSLIGIKQYKDGEEYHIVFDMKNDIMANYSNEDGQKKVTALPNMLSIGGAFVKANVDEEDMERSMSKTGKTKKIQGYQCEEWEIEDKETITKAMIATEFPISWKDSHSQFLKQILPTTQRDEMPEGMALKSETKTKAKSKKSTFEVKKIIDEPTTIDNSEYEKVGYSVEN